MKPDDANTCDFCTLDYTDDNDVIGLARRKLSDREAGIVEDLFESGGDIARLRDLWELRNMP